MGSGPGASGAFLAGAFRSALLHQLAVIAVISLILLAAWTVIRWRFPALAAGGGVPRREPSARWALRTGFGVLWLLDGILQLQPAMPAGLADQVIRPAAASSPGWTQSLVNWAVTLWDYHPVTAASSAVWIQVGIGLALLCAPRGPWSRLAALAGAGWGLAVWVFGEAFGGIFAPGLSALFGAPGAALLYAVAGALLALPGRAWRRRWPGRVLLGATGAAFLVLAVVQAWPSSGFWKGTVAGKPGPLASMIGSMASTPQPRALTDLLTGFGNLARSDTVAVNLVAVLVLTAGGAALAVTAARPAPWPAAGEPVSRAARAQRYAVAALAVCCLVIWLLFQDLGFFGGLGTDPNSMVPLIVLFGAGYLGLAPAPAPAPAPADAVSSREAGAAGQRAARVPGYAVATLGSLAVVLVGAVPMAAASAQPNADPVVAEASAGQVSVFSKPAPGFTLTSQRGRPVALSALRGKTVLLTFLDPVCTTDCPVIAREMLLADRQLRARARAVALVAVVANPTYLSTAYTRAFTRQEGLGAAPNWLYLTGSLRQLRAVWDHYGVQVEDSPAGAMTSHDDLAFVISPRGVITAELNADPGPGTPVTTSSFATLMADSVRHAMRAG
ncbi:MAG: SCO family protein [Streptosporangiales bacterium]|nr:SCO family protein [Streptosporangiales bacterium]